MAAERFSGGARAAATFWGIAVLFLILMVVVRVAAQPLLLVFAAVLFGTSLRGLAEWLRGEGAVACGCGAGGRDPGPARGDGALVDRDRPWARGPVRRADADAHDRVRVCAHAVPGLRVGPARVRRVIGGFPADAVRGARGRHPRDGGRVVGQVVFGAVWGILGLTLATPLLACVVVLVHKLYVEDVLEDG